MNTPVILFRPSFETEEELLVAQKYLKVVKFRSEIPQDSLVIGRYSVLPYYRELEEELETVKGSKIINSWSDHTFIADATHWSSPGGPLYGWTPRTWTEWGRLPSGVSFVLKGRTNSRKHQWRTHMFAENRSEVPVIASRLLEDSLIREQGVIVREYFPLKQLAEGINGLPITNEWRTFWYAPAAGEVKLLASGYYWASHPECLERASLPPQAIAFAKQAATFISPQARFFVLDIAELKNGNWCVIEVNDAQMSGLSMCSAEELYSNLATALK